MRQPASKHKGNPCGVVDIVPRPFSFCKGKRHCVKHPPLQQNPPELENLPHAGPRGNHPAARGRGGSESLTPFLCSTLFAFFMCPVSHTFPACNGNEMPSWYTIIFFVYGRVVDKPRCLLLFFLCPVLRGCAGVEGAFPCGGIPSWNRKEKRLPRPLPARGARLQTEAEPGYFPPQTLRVSGGRSNHSWLFRWKNLAQIRNRLLCFPPIFPPHCPAHSTS